jgi:hypothetical protein
VSIDGDSGSRESPVIPLDIEVATPAPEDSPVASFDAARRVLDRLQPLAPTPPPPPAGYGPLPTAGAPGDGGEAGADGGDAGGDGGDAEGYGGERGNALALVTEPDVAEQLRALRLEIAEAADTVRVSRDDPEFDYFKTELGLNMIVPKGKVTELRFRASLGDESDSEVIALDGFPKSDVDETAIISGQVRVALDDALRFLPLPPGVALPVSVALDPWEFRIGTKRRIRVQFSGGLTSAPEWYATETALTGEFRVALTGRIRRGWSNILAEIEVVLRYDPGFWHRTDVYARTGSVMVWSSP